MGNDHYEYRKYLERWHARSTNPNRLPMTSAQFKNFRAQYDNEMPMLQQRLNTVRGYNDGKLWNRIEVLEELMAL